MVEQGMDIFEKFTHSILSIQTILMIVLVSQARIQTFLPPCEKINQQNRFPDFPDFPDFLSEITRNLVLPRIYKARIL